MNISSSPQGLAIQTGDAKMTLQSTHVVVNEYVMDFPGEYERRGVFVEVREVEQKLIFICTIEGKTVIYLPENTTVSALENLRDLNNKDMVIFPANESLWKTVETWEASVVVVYGEGSEGFLKKLGQGEDGNESATIKSADFESEVTRFVALK